MRLATYFSKELERLLKRQKIATMEELKSVLGSEIDVTVFRKLAELDYCTSYSHRGGYYTLKSITDFDELGLWSYRAIWFSEYGTLRSTIEMFVNSSEAGYFAWELEHLLHVGVKETLLKLVRNGKIARQKVSGRYLYCCEGGTKRKQLQQREIQEEKLGGVYPLEQVQIPTDDLKAAVILFFSLLDERQRRLYAGLESLKIGHGGDQLMAGLLGLNPGTVAKGRQELLAQDVEVERVRRSGGGRKSLEKKHRRS